MCKLFHDSAGQLLVTINDILDISNMQSGQYTLDNKEFPLLAVAEATAAHLADAAKDADLTLSCKADR